MRADIAEIQFRAFRALYECLLDDLVLTYGNAFDRRLLTWEKIQTPYHELTMLLSYDGVSMLAFETTATNLEYNLRFKSRVN